MTNEDTYTVKLTEGQIDLLMTVFTHVLDYYDEKNKPSYQAAAFRLRTNIKKQLGRCLEAER